MARMPGVIWKPLPEAGAPDGYVKTQFIVHSTGTRASAANNWSYFAKSDVVVESTFIVGETPADPTLQVMDSTDRADANVSASLRAIAVEVVGDGVGPFTQWQVQELIRIGRWAADTHPIARRVIPSEAASGFGWHVMFGAPGPWTSVRGKVCPGNARIDQLKRVVFPAIFATSAGKPPAPATNPEELDMDPALLTKIVHDTTGDVITKHGLDNAGHNSAAILQELAGLRAAVGKLADAVAQGGGSSAAELKAAVIEAIQENVVRVEVAIAGRDDSQG